MFPSLLFLFNDAMESENVIILLLSCSETQRQYLVWSQSLKALGQTCITHSLSEPLIQNVVGKHYTNRSLVIIDTSEELSLLLQCPVTYTISSLPKISPTPTRNDRSHTGNNGVE